MNTKRRKHRINNGLKSGLSALDMLYIVKTALSNPRQPQKDTHPYVSIIETIEAKILV